MKRTWDGFWALALIALVATACAHDEGQSFVRKLEISGNAEVSDGAIKEGLETRALSWWPFMGRVPFDELAWQRDLSRAETFYKTKGFFDARIESEDVVDTSPARVDIQLVVHEGSRYRVESVRVAPPESQVLLKKATARLLALQGRPFDQDRYIEARDLLAKAWTDEGFCESKVTGSVVVHRQAQSVEIEVVATPGPQCFIRGVLMRGDVDVGSDIILSHSRLEKGMLVTPEHLRKAEHGIYALGLFSLVRLEVNRRGETVDKEQRYGRKARRLELRERPLPADVGPHKGVIITLYVQSRPPREVKAGVGIGFDRARQQVRASGGWSHRNFLGGLRTLSLSGLVGYNFVPALWERTADGPSAQAGIHFIQPGFLEPALTFQANASYNLVFEETFQYHAPTARIGLERPFYWDLKASVGFEVTYYDFFNVKRAVLNTESNPLRSDFRDPFLLTLLTEAIEWDGRDNSLVTRNGIYARLATSQALSPLGSDFQFLKVEGDLRGYYSPWRWLTVASRVLNGYAWGFGDGGAVPVTSRYFAGGANSVRGFDYNRLSPYAEQCYDSGKCQRVPVGGLTILTTSLESRFHHGWGLSTVLFTDVGNVDEQAFRVAPGALTWNAGLGLRYLTPVGPARLDFAYRLSDPERFAHLARWTFYVTLGEAF